MLLGRWRATCHCEIFHRKILKISVVDYRIIWFNKSIYILNDRNKPDTEKSKYSFKTPNFTRHARISQASASRKGIESEDGLRRDPIQITVVAAIIIVCMQRRSKWGEIRQKNMSPVEFNIYFIAYRWNDWFLRLKTQ